MTDNAGTVPVTLDVAPDTAEALQDPVTRAHAARVLSRLVQPEGAQLNDDGPRHTEAERAEASDLVERFKAFRVGKTLGGLDLKELIAEGRR